MRRSLLVMLVALLALLIAACQPASTPAPAPTQPPAQATSAQVTAIPPTEATAVNTPGAVAPAATPDIEKVIKAQPDDWKRGLDGAGVTIIEWGDFQ